MTIDDLAGMVKRGFDDVNKGMNKRFDEVKNRLDKLETGQEDIKLRLDHCAYRFELNELEKRVHFLEKKAKFA